MISNLPFMAAHQEFQARHSDMLTAARNESLSKAEAVPLNPYVYCKERRTLVRREGHLADHFVKSDAKIGSTLRIRVPRNYVVTDGPSVDWMGC